MKQRLTLRWFIITLTGVFFAAYSAYNLFVISRNGSALPPEGQFITVLLIVLFGVLTAFAWTVSFRARNFRIVRLRRTLGTISLLLIFLLKLRLIDRVAAYFDFSKMYTVLYCGAYFMTLAALLILLIYYTFIIKDLPLYPRASFILPIVAILLFLFSFIMEIILYYEYNIGLESSPLRTMVTRPIFYFGFMGLSAYFLFPPEMR